MYPSQSIGSPEATHLSRTEQGRGWDGKFLGDSNAALVPEQVWTTYDTLSFADRQQSKSNMYSREEDDRHRKGRRERWSVGRTHQKCTV